MNYKFLILRSIYENENISQRDLAKEYYISLGKINLLFHELVEDGYLKKVDKYTLTNKAIKYLNKYKVKSAVILAAGKGVRFAPLTYDTPKGLIKVNGKRMIERQIAQLLERNINDITIIVGYLKESFDYLIDKFNVKLIYNPEFDTKNTISSLYCAKNIFLKNNSYLLVSDNYMKKNIYHEFEFETWYNSVFMQGKTNEWKLTVNSKSEITKVEVGGEDCLVMYGPAFFTKSFSKKFFKKLIYYYNKPGCENYYWEDVFMREINNLDPMFAYRIEKEIIYEFECFEELRAFDKSYDESSGSKPMKLVAKIFDVKEQKIKNIRCVKKGMTNYSWMFSLEDKKGKYKDYLFRMPGTASNKLIDRHKEKKVYDVILDEMSDKTEHIIYLDENDGYKISEYFDNSRTVNIKNEEDIKNAMQMIKFLHNKRLKVDFNFDLLDRINYYENLITNSNHSILFLDYRDIKSKVLKVINKINSLKRPKVLCHIDSCADNILFTNEGVKLIDWEYASMQDPLIDIAMFAIYSFLEFDDINRLIKYYNEDKTSNRFNDNIAFKNLTIDEAKTLIVAYMGVSGLIWALWALYKSSQGESFGEYALKNYRYFKDSYKYLLERNFV